MAARVRTWQAVVLLLTASCTGAGEQDSFDRRTESPALEQAQEQTEQDDEDTGYADLVERVEPSVVTARTDDGVGSGVVLRSDVIVSNHHVVADRNEVDIAYADGTTSSADVVATDEVTDLAVLRTERDNLPVPEYRKDLPRQGDTAIAIGSPLGFENSVTSGIISGLHREIPGSDPEDRSLVDLIQTDTPISPGNSGGALLDSAGRVVGINEAYIPPRTGAVSLGFAIPAATVLETTDELLSEGVATHPFLGLSLGRLTPEIRDQLDTGVEHGVVVLEVADGEPADAAGLRRGDVLVRFGDQQIHSVAELQTELRQSEPDQERDIEYVRDGEHRETTVTIGSRPGS